MIDRLLAHLGLVRLSGLPHHMFTAGKMSHHVPATWTAENVRPYEFSATLASGVRVRGDLYPY